MVITALVLGVFIPIVQATTGTANEVRNRVVVDVYLKDDATEADRIEVQRELEATPGVKSVEYISKDEALRELGTKVDDAKGKIELLGSNPLPSLFRVTPDDPDELKAIVAQHRARAARPQLRRHRRGAQPRERHRQDPVRDGAREGPRRGHGRRS